MLVLRGVDLVFYTSCNQGTPLSIFDQNVHPFIELVELSIFLHEKFARAQIFAPPGQIWLAAPAPPPWGGGN